ncbi:MAG: ABC transporter permease [Candidatus Viridilinea halotolerans]|uniref:ABC transporter permease n=1 Tax=Candidatus Viridilinea halotolerans TaxID=2491704 RepID=A0A426TRI7_9CHLR|nr:MAG: ABC transporter permease [Candidatus Viridilinea halotolerans]
MRSLYLAVTEIARNKLRFVVVFLIVALITILVLFTAALGDGLAQSTSEYLDGLDASLLAFQSDVNYQIPASRLGRSRLNAIRRVPGVLAVGPIGVSSATIIAVDGVACKELSAALIGVEPRAPGSPPVLRGDPLANSRAADAVVDQHIVERLGLPIGATITLKVVQGMEEQHYNLRVVGATSGSKINFTPAIFVPLQRWDRIRPQEQVGGSGNEIIFNIVAVQLDGSVPSATVADEVMVQVAHVEMTDPVTAYKATQGYQDMQSTLSLQQGFVLVIVVLIIGSFFQIQTLQKVAQIGMLKAIGASSWTVVGALLFQIMLTLLVGLSVGLAAVWLLAQALPTGIPLVFSGGKIAVAIASILAAGPLAAMLAVRTILKIEPLRALGLSA